MIDRTDIRELREVIDAARIILNTATIPDGRAADARELLEHAVKMTDNLIARPPLSAMKPKTRKARW